MLVTPISVKNFIFYWYNRLFQILFRIIYHFLPVENGLPSSDSTDMKINVKISGTDHGNLIIEVKSEWNVLKLKEVIANKTQLQTHGENSQLRIIFAGKELHNSVTLKDYSVGQYSIIHAVKTKQNICYDDDDDDDTNSSNPISNALLQLELRQDDSQVASKSVKSCFYVYCSTCKDICSGKLRVHCAECDQGTLTIEQEPRCWDDVLEPARIHGQCQSDNCDGDVAAFFFKCSSDAHKITSSRDSIDNRAVPLNLLRANLYDVCCMICADICPIILVFSCESTHVICLDCFSQYCKVRLMDRQFVQDPVYGYTLPCSAGCKNSLIKETHHFRVLDDEMYERYQRFGAEECVLQSGGVLCPRPNCGAGILPDENCRQITCVMKGSNGCGFVFCRLCLQGFHLGECTETLDEIAAKRDSKYQVDNEKANQAKWNEASQSTIKSTTKPCPKCRTPTESSGGCMHMTCTRPGCGQEWCWLCQNEWTRNCMADHWFQ